MNEHLRVTLSMTCISVLFWILLLGGIALSSRLLPSRWYCYDNAFFRTRDWELKLYHILHVRRWKDYLPELGHIVGFAKDHLPDQITREYLDRFLWEACYTEAAHWICMLAGFSYLFLALLLDEPRRYIGIFLAISIVNFFAHLPFIIIQRYNRPRLYALREMLGREAS